MNGRTTHRPWESPGYLGAVVSRQPLRIQALTVMCIYAGLSVATLLSVTVSRFALPVGRLAVNMAVVSASLPLFCSGFMHFTQTDGFSTIVPHDGAWGFWHLPGGPRFHTLWSGIVEIVLPLRMYLFLIFRSPQSHRLIRETSLYLFVFLAAVTFANIYMYTHNAPGPFNGTDAVPRPRPVKAHLIRAGFQVILLTIFWNGAR